MLLLVSLALLSSRAHALSGNKLYELCESPGALFVTACDHYVWGSAEGVIYMNRLAAAASKDINRGICLPDAITPRQIMDLIKKYLKDHPAERNETASSLVFAALSDAYPCN